MNNIKIKGRSWTFSDYQFAYLFPESISGQPIDLTCTCREIKYYDHYQGQYQYHKVICNWCKLLKKLELTRPIEVVRDVDKREITIQEI